MKPQLSILVAVLGLTSAPILAYAQTTTLVYQGGIDTGTITTYNASNYYQGGSSSPFTGSVTAFLSMQGSLTSGTDYLTYDIRGPIFEFNGTSVGSDGHFLLGPGGVDLTLLNGVITGAMINIDQSSGNGANYNSVHVNSTGDSFASGSFRAGVGYGTAIVGSGPPGVWTVTQAPEIDPASAVSAFTLLLGGLAVLRGRRTTSELKRVVA